MTKLSERDFLKIIEDKSSEEKKILATEVMPEWARGLGEWLVVNPWRVMIPVSAISYIVFRISAGTRIRELILGLFGGF